MSKIRLLPAISAFVITFALLFGGYKIYRNLEILQPLQKQLHEIPAVLGVQVENIMQTPAVVIKLGQVNDLQATYDKIQNAIINTTGASAPVTIVDKRDAALENFYEGILQPILYQGIAQGDYVNMISRIANSGQIHHVNYKITMDSQDIYIQLAQQHAYLYDIVPYSQKSSGVNSQ